MACDSAYGAYLKAYYPYEFYLTQLKLYTEKKDRDKIAALANEMYEYAGISLTSGRFGQDNRDWLIDKENKTISQSLSSIKYISRSAANTLFEIRDKAKTIKTFSELLRYIQYYTSIDTRQIETLIKLNYFEMYGNNKKLLNVFEEFFNGENRITKTHTSKTVEKRLQILTEYENKCENESCDPVDQLNFEIDNLGMCLSKFSDSKYTKCFYVLSLDTTYGIKVKLYSVARRSIGEVRFTKKTFEENRFEVGNLIYCDEFERKQKCIYTRTENGKFDDKFKKTPIAGEYEIWIKKYHK